MKTIKYLSSAIVSVSKVLNIAGIVVLGMLTCMTVADVLGRYLFKLPIIGSVELTEYMMACIAFLGLGWCAAADRHVKVTLLTSRLESRVQAILNSVMLFITFGFLVVMTWRGIAESLVIRQTNRQSLLLEIPVYPFYWVMALGLFVLCLIVLVQFIQSVIKAVSYEQ